MSLADSLRSATYNPEAEKAMKEEQQKAAKVIKEIKDYLDTIDKSREELLANPGMPQVAIKKMEQFTKDARKWITSNPRVTELEAKNKQEEIIKQGSELYTMNLALMVSSSAERVMTYLSNDFEQKKLLNSADRKTYAEMLDKLKKFNASNKNPTFDSLKEFGVPFARELESFSKSKGFYARQDELFRTALFNPKKFQEDMKGLETQQEEVKKLEDEKFSFQRFAKKVTATAGSVIGGLFYVMFCFVIGMLAANQAIGREPAYRILYFIYGAIFAPILAFYYIYLWFNDKAPKIYTLLPITQMVPETTIGRFLLFPFAYKEDKTARDLLVEFMTGSAEMVGKTFDSKSLGSIGQQVETVAENLKNLTTDAAEAATKAVEKLPSLNSLRVNALKPNTPS